MRPCEMQAHHNIHIMYAMTHTTEMLYVYISLDSQSSARLHETTNNIISSSLLTAQLRPLLIFTIFDWKEAE